MAVCQDFTLSVLYDRTVAVINASEILQHLTIALTVGSCGHKSAKLLFVQLVAGIIHSPPSWVSSYMQPARLQNAAGINPCLVSRCQSRLPSVYANQVLGTIMRYQVSRLVGQTSSDTLLSRPTL